MPRTFSLSDGTKRVISEIDEPLKISFIYSRNLSKNIPIIQNYANQVQGLLNRYADLANEKMVELLNEDLELIVNFVDQWRVFKTHPVKVSHRVTEKIGDDETIGEIVEFEID